MPAKRPRQHSSRLGQKLLKFTRDIDSFDTPGAVLNALHAITAKDCQMNVLGALQFPLKFGDLASLVEGQTIFLHSSAPKGWWEEYVELSQQHPSIAYMLARLSLGPFTESDMLRMVQPLAVDRWSVELSQKHGIRDGFTCPVGGRWVVGFWTSKVLTDEFSPELRAMLFMAATFAAIRLQKIVGAHADRLGRPVSLTTRELAVLRLLSLGNQTREVAEQLELGEETVRSHIKKAQVKLGVRNRLHAVAQAMRQRLIP